MMEPPRETGTCLFLPDRKARAFAIRSSLCEATDVELSKEFLPPNLTGLQELGSMVHTKACV